MDFGTTYTGVYYWDGASKNLKGVLDKQTDQKPFQPTMVLIHKDKFHFGSAARDILVNPYKAPQISKLFTGFKMLMGKMSNDVILRDRGYDTKGEFCPENIAEAYLKDRLEMIRMRCPDGKHIEKIVIGAPQIWFIDVDSINARDSLQHILSKIKDDFNRDHGNGAISDIVLESEPALACAYYIDRYRRRENKDFNGHVLLIDYGGGTLDINLCNVRQSGDDCEIKIQARTGKGINDSALGLIGSAGMAFLDAVIQQTSQVTGLSNHEKQFLLQSLESELMEPSKMVELQKKFSHAKRAKVLISKLWDEKFAELADVNETVITYGMLYDAFQHVIADTLKDALDDISKQMDYLGIPFRSDHGDGSLKIVFTGGFCNFYLTRMEAEDYFKIISGDSRTNGMEDGSEGRECAIACGAALVAAGIVNIKQTYPYTLGIANEDCSKKWQVFSAGEDMVYDIPRYIDTVFIASAIPNLYFDDPPKYVKPLPKYRIDIDTTKCKIGFSLDKMLNITVWVLPMEEISDGWRPKGNPTRLILPDLHTVFGKIVDIGDK